MPSLSMRASCPAVCGNVLRMVMTFPRALQGSPPQKKRNVGRCHISHVFEGTKKIKLYLYMNDKFMINYVVRLCIPPCLNEHRLEKLPLSFFTPHTTVDSIFSCFVEGLFRDGTLMNFLIGRWLVYIWVCVLMGECVVSP